MRLVIADDRPLAAEGLRRLAEAGGVTVPGIAATVRRLEQLAGEAAPDLAIVGAGLWHGNLDAPGALERLRARAPGLTVVVHGAAPAMLRAPAVLARGADAYLSDEIDADVLMPVLRALAARTCSSAPHTERSEPPLTARERELLALLAEGRSTAEIAADTGLAPGTVKTHLARIYLKLGVRGRTGAVRAAFANGGAAIGRRR